MPKAKPSTHDVTGHYVICVRLKLTITADDTCLRNLIDLISNSEWSYQNWHPPVLDCAVAPVFSGLCVPLVWTSVMPEGSNGTTHSRFFFASYAPGYAVAKNRSASIVFGSDRLSVATIGVDLRGFLAMEGDFRISKRCWLQRSVRSIESLGEIKRTDMRPRC